MDTEQCPCDHGAPGADHAAQPEHLAAVHAERDNVMHSACAAKVSDFSERNFVCGVVLFGIVLLDLSTHHLAHDRADVKTKTVPRADDLAVLQDRNDIHQRDDFVQPMRNVEDRDTVAFHASQQITRGVL